MWEKVGKSRNTVFPMIWGSGGSKSRLAKAAGAEPAGQMRDEKLHAVVARSTFRSENVQNTPASDHFWKLRCRKSARRCGAKHISKSKCTKHTMFGPLLEVQMSKKCTPLWREAHFQVKMYKTLGVRTTFGGSDVVSRGLQRCIFRGRRNTKDMFMRDVRRSGRWFPERGCILEYQMCRFAKMILRDRCSTSYDLASIFRGRRSTLDRWSGKIAKSIGTRLSALHFTFHFLKEVSRNCFVFDVVKFRNWRSLAELLRFGGCQVQKLETSRRIVSSLLLSTSKNEEVSQKCFVFKLGR